MSNTLKNPFFIAIAAAVAIGTACALLLGPNTKDAGQAFVVGGTFMLFALIPTMLIAFLVIVVQRQTAKVKAEQAAAPREVLRKRYENQMIWSLVWTVAGVVITVVTYLLAQGSGGGAYVICTGAIIFGFLSFLQGMFGWFRNQ